MATIEGVFLAPGVSKNGRLYTKEAIGRAVTRMRNRLSSGGPPITMLTHHAAGDDSTRIAARVTDVWADASGAAHWRAVLAENTAGRDIAALVTPEQPFLSNVSIRGWWVGPVRTETVDGTELDVADDIEVDGIDFTKNPGVTAARITSAETETRSYITESVEVRLMTETTEATYADPGYRNGEKRLPLGNRREILAAWAVSQTDETYTPNQIKRIRGRVKAAADKAGFDVVAETDAQIAVTTEALEEAYASMNLDAGAGDIRVSGYVNDPSQLTAVARKVALAALAGMAALDPDQDGDIDIDPADETAPAAPAVEETIDKEALVGTETTTATESAVPAPPKPFDQMNEQELREYAASLHTKPVEETETPEGETTETVVAPLTADNVKTIVAEAIAEAVKALGEKPAEETTETAEVSERDALKAEVTKEVVAEVAQMIAKSGMRKGLVKVAETDEPAKPLHTMTDEEFRAYRNDTLGALLPS